MTRIWDERFEGAGYEETWSDGETVGSGNTLDEDADTADVGSPTHWGDQCLKVVRGGAGNTNSYVENEFNNEPDFYTRLHIIITSSSFDTNNEFAIVFTCWDASFNDCMTLRIRHNGSALTFQAIINHDGNDNYYSSDPIALNTEYRVEFAWDSSADTWGWKLDGVIQDSGSLTGGHVTSIQPVRLGLLSGTDKAITTYIDLLAVDDADWVGAEPTGADPMSTTMRLALGM